MTTTQDRIRNRAISARLETWPAPSCPRLQAKASNYLRTREAYGNDRVARKLGQIGTG
jgi:hypothetical protein